MRFLPVFLDLQSGPVLLVGAGDLARAKLRLLTSAGARVRWYATDGNHDLAGLTAEDAARIEIAQGDPLAADLKGVIAILCAGAGDIGIAMPCTSRTSADEDTRAGRWRGRPKTECGIHTTPTS